MNPNDKSMHPDDKRNMIVFFMACVGLFLIYDIFINQPNLEKLKAAQEQAKLNAPIAQAEQVASLTREQAMTSSRRVTIDTDTLSGSVNPVGARIDDLSLKSYMTEPQGDETVTLLNPKGVDHAYYGEFGWLSNDPTLKMPNKDTRWSVNSRTLSNDKGVKLSWSNGRGLNFAKEITIDDKYMFTVNQSVRNTTNKAVTIYPFALIGRDGMPDDLTGAFVLHEGPVGYIGDELH